MNAVDSFDIDWEPMSFQPNAYKVYYKHKYLGRSKKPIATFRSCVDAEQYITTKEKELGITHEEI